MTVLITGGSGYIGSHVVRLLREQGVGVVVLDDFVTGNVERLGSVPRVEIDLASDSAPAVVTETIERFAVDSVIHFAARKQVGESVARPAWYYAQNVGSLANVLLGLEGTSVGRFVFSSSAAVYGTTQGVSIAETDPTVPINPYGATKLAGEELVTAVANATSIATASLRYFNVAGAGWDELGDTAVLNLVPMVFERLDRGLPPLIFGGDYDTPDGSCVRDYIHVLDLAEAHVAALEYLRAPAKVSSVFNVGTGVGSSVREVIAEISRVSGVEIMPDVRDRRPGDPAEVVASPQLINEELGWKSRRGLRQIIESAWRSHQLLRGAAPNV